MDPGVAGIIGGAVGSLLTGLVRALGISSEVRAHDAAVEDRNRQLGTWVADRNYFLSRECVALRSDFAGTAPPPSGADQYGNDNRAEWEARAAALDREIADARGLALHEYRDQERRAALAVADILSAEGWPHAAWRKLRHHPAPPLTTPDEAEPILNSWRAPTAMNPERQTWPDDATKRTLADALASVRALGP